MFKYNEDFKDYLPIFQYLENNKLQFERKFFQKNVFHRLNE